MSITTPAAQVSELLLDMNFINSLLAVSCNENEIQLTFQKNEQVALNASGT